MSLPHNGSTAPTISSPLLAWPSKPAMRLSPSLQSPSASPSPQPAMTTFPRRPSSSTSTTLTANGTMSASSSMASSSMTAAEEDLDGDLRSKGSPRTYTPPRQPLDPQRLGRIAQSFGINVPSLPDFALISLSHHSVPQSAPVRPASPYCISRNTIPRISSPHLLTVLPPTLLLPPPPSPLIEEDGQDRLLRWRRGKLLPLQPTLKIMTHSIAREWGLPSTQGLEIYLSSRSGEGGGMAGLGPLITAQTWPTLFQSYFARPATPTSINRAVSPASIDRLRTDSLESSQSSSSIAPSIRRNDLVFPPTPLSWNGAPSGSANATSESAAPVIATLEFNIDLEQAAWVEGWRAGGGSRRAAASPASTSTSTLKRRSLTLVKKLEKGSQPRFLADIAAVADAERRAAAAVVSNADSDSDSDAEVIEDEGYAALTGSSDEDQSVADEDEEEDEDATGGAFEHDNDNVFDDDLVELRASRASTGPARALDISDIGTHAVLAPDATFPDAQVETPNDDDDVSDVLAMLRSEGGPPTRRFVDEDRLLASPIALDRFGLGAAGGDKRASGIVMSEKLDDLEKALRSLSPRDLRLTSPRVLPPGELASPLSSASLPIRTVSRPARSPLIPAPDSPSSQAFEKPSWPAVPFAVVNSPVMSRHSESEQGRSTPLSSETMQRMESPSTQRSPANTGWKPQRPARPPSPDLGLIAAREHPLSPEIVQAIERHMGEGERHAGESPKAVEPDPPRRDRSNSISLKGLRHQMSIPKINKIWNRKDGRIPDMPTSQTEIGLFAIASDYVRASEEDPARPRVERGESESSVRGIPDEFGFVQSQTSGSSSSLPSKSSNGFGRRILHGFGGSRKREPGSPETSTTRQRVISSPIVVQKGTGLDPPSTIPNTPPSPAVPDSTSSQNLNSPTSPRSVRRKPVPGLDADDTSATAGGTNANAIPNSMSLASSMASFVLDEPPKRKVRAA